MADQGVRVDQAEDSGDELGSGAGGGSAPSGGGTPGEPDAKDAPGTKGVPSDGAEGPPPSAGTDENPLGDPKDGPPTVVDDGGVGVEGLVGAGGSGGDGGGGLFGGLADAAGDVADALDDASDQAGDAAGDAADTAEDVYDQGEDLAHQTYDDIEKEVDQTNDDAFTIEDEGEHWGGLAGTPDLGPLDDHDTDLDEAARDAIDAAARDAGDAFRDAGDTVNELYDDSGAPAAVADAREAGAVVVPDVVEDVYDQGEDMAHQTYGDVVKEVVQTYEDASIVEYQEGEHWGGLVGTPDQWVEPLVDGAENVAETPGDWYEKSGVDGGFGTGAADDGAGGSSVPDVDDYGRGYESGALRPLAPDDGLAGGAEETAELAGEEEAQRVTAEVGDLTAGPGPVEVPGDAIEAPEPIELEAVGEVDEVIEPV